MRDSFVKNSLFGSIAAVSFTLGNFASSLLVARLLGVKGAGTYFFAVWVIWTVTTVTGAGLPFTIARFLPDVSLKRGEAAARRLAAFLLRPTLALSVIPLLAAIGYALWTLGAGGTAGSLGDPILCLLVALSCLAQTLGDVAKGYLRGVHSLDRTARLTALGAGVQLAATAIGCMFFGVRGAIVGYFLGAVVPIAPLRDIWRERAELTVEFRDRVVRYAKYRWASEIAASFVFSRVEVFFLQIFWGASSVGLLTASMVLANVAIQGPMMLTLGLLPHFSEQFARNDRQSLQNSYTVATRVMGFLMLPACFGLAAIVPVMLPMLYGQAFAPAVPSAQILVIAAGLSTATVGSNLISAMERSDIDFYFGGIGAGVSILGGVCLIGPFGIMGAVYSRVLTQLVVIGLGTWYLNRKAGFYIPFVALGKLAACAMVCAAVARTVLIFSPGPLGLLLAVGAGAIVYIALVRLTSALDTADIQKLSSIAEHLPVPAVPIARRLARLALG